MVKFLSDSFEFCSAVITNLTEAQLDAVHNSPDGRFPGSEALLALYVQLTRKRLERKFGAFPGHAIVCKTCTL